jgi:hypothetical protein
MSELIINEIQDVKTSVREISSLNNDLVFGIVCYKYFYNDGRFDKIDFKTSYTDGANDGGIDLIAVNDNDLAKTLVLIQSKNVQGFNSKDEIKDVFTKMTKTVDDFKALRISAYNERLKRIYIEKFDDSKDDPNFNIELVLFLGFDKDAEYKEMILEHLSHVKELNDFEISIFYKSDIEQQIESFSDERKFVKEGEIKIFKEDGTIKNNENGLLVNISALSLRKLFYMYSKKGLFEQNFRYFVKNQKIDEQIEESLKSKRNRFWFLNNGIIIGCKEFKKDGDNVKLWDFSIVNGCQTTTMLGKYSGPSEELDFPIPCKIVKPDQLGDDYFNKFISEIAEASNSQKPISDRDLKSNLPEQKNLQKVLQKDEPRVYLEIKRGEITKRSKNIEPWQKIKNDALGQLILSVLLQQPGTARSNKKKIFSELSTYNKVFKRTPDKSAIIDILKISNYYDLFLEGASNLNEINISIAKNGKLSILGIIGFFIKNERNKINLSFDTNTKDWSNDVMTDNLSGSLLNEGRPDNYLEILNSIFNQIIRSLSTLYRTREGLETSVSDFFKTDKTYHSIILERIKTEFILDDYEYQKFKTKFREVFYVSTQ